MSFFDNNFADANLGYTPSEGSTFDGYSFDSDQLPEFMIGSGVLDSGAPIADPNGSHDWYLNPSPEGGADQAGYQGSILLGATSNQFVDPYPLDMANNFAAGESPC